MGKGISYTVKIRIKAVQLSNLTKSIKELLGVHADTCQFEARRVINLKQSFKRFWQFGILDLEESGHGGFEHETILV